jgi:chitin synthase
MLGRSRTKTYRTVVISIVHSPPQIIPLVLLGLILGLPAILIVITAHSWSYVGWMFIYLLSLPVWNFILPTYAFWKFDDFSWGETRKTAGEKTKKAGIEYEGEFDSSKITMKRWAEFERDRRVRALGGGGSGSGSGAGPWASKENVVGGYAYPAGAGGGGAGTIQGWSQPLGHGGQYDEYYSDV